MLCLPPYLPETSVQLVNNVGICIYINILIVDNLLFLSFLAAFTLFEII